MQRAGLSTLILFIGGAALFVDMFMRWVDDGPGGDAVEGWNLPQVGTAGTIALGLTLVEFARIQAVWWSPTSSLLGFFLAAGAAILVIGGLVHLHWGGFFSRLPFSRFSYGAWIGLAISVALLVGSALRLLDHKADEQHAT